LASSRLPGPIGVAAATRTKYSGRTATTGSWVDFDVGTLAATVEPASRVNTSIRLADAVESDSGYHRIEFATLEQTRIAATRLLANGTLATQLRERSGIAGVKLIDWTAQQLHVDALKVLWRQRRAAAVAVEPPAPAAKPRPTPAWAPPPAPAPAPAYSTFPPDLDAAAVAQALADAARDGVPFCEECMKAAPAASVEQPSGSVQ
jgi:hypothetical protein